MKLKYVISKGYTGAVKESKNGKLTTPEGINIDPDSVEPNYSGLADSAIERMYTTRRLQYKAGLPELEKGLCWDIQIHPREGECATYLLQVVSVSRGSVIANSIERDLPLSEKDFIQDLGEAVDTMYIPSYNPARFIYG